MYIRLWHKYLIRYLPRQQLLSQWRELKCIAKSIKENNTPNHILVNKIMNYNLNHLCEYMILVYNEMIDRNYKVNQDVFDYIYNITDNHFHISIDNIFNEWHNYRYLKQCLYNLQEKYDCGGITNEEWETIYKKFKKIIKNY